MRPVRCLETSDSNHTVTQRHIPEERRRQLHRCESLESHNAVSSFVYIASNYKIVTDESVVQNKKGSGCSFRVLSRPLSGEIEENHEISQDSRCVNTDPNGTEMSLEPISSVLPPSEEVNSWKSTAICCTYGVTWCLSIGTYLYNTSDFSNTTKF
jgi:hypothetical protein